MSDGIEIVVSLVLLAGATAIRLAGVGGVLGQYSRQHAGQHRTGATDPVGWVVAAWPAFALLVAIKLLSGLVDGPSERFGTVPRRSAP